MNEAIAWTVGLLVGAVVTAAAVHALAPEQRLRVRRIVILFLLYASALAIHFGLLASGSEHRAGYFLVAAQLLQAFTLINIVTTLGFGVLLPRIRLTLPLIATDLLVGLGYIITTLGVLAGHGIEPSSLVAGGAVASAVLAISLQSTLGNILGGVALQVDGSINEGDWIQLENGKQGRVKQVRWRHTVVETRDWSTIIVPNTVLLGSNITILGKRDGRAVPQRMWVWFNVDFRYSPSRVIDVVLEGINAAPIENVAPDPRPSVVCMDFTMAGRESFATYAVRYWILDLATDDPTNSRVRARIHSALARAQIPLAVPAHTAFVEMRNQEREEQHQARDVAAHLRALETVSLFQHLKPEELRTLAAGMKPVIYTAGEIVTRQDAIAHWLYVLTSGRVEVRMSVDPDGPGALPKQTKTVATINAPGFFGEMGLMTGQPRTADVVAMTDIECYRLGKETFQEVLLARPEIMGEISEKMAARRVELLATRDGLDQSARISMHPSERDKILSGMKEFFGL